MRGDNPIRPPFLGDGQVLQVHSIFATVQGEGPDAGTPAVFVRLGGCNLACDFCDTEFEGFSAISLGDVAATVKNLATNVCKLAVITGGEPLRQNIVPLCEALLAAGMRVQIETNGTLWQPLPPAVEIICSPKNAGRGYAPLRQDVLGRTKALKFIISSTRPDYQDVGEVGQSQFSIPVYVQPMDEEDTAKNAANTARALHLAQTHGYRLSLQLHKILGIA